MPGGEKHNQDRVSIKCGKINAGNFDGAIHRYAQLHLTVFTRTRLFCQPSVMSQKIPCHLATENGVMHEEKAAFS